MQRLHRALYVGLEDNIEFLEIAHLDTLGDFVESEVFLGSETDFAGELLVLGGFFAGGTLVLHHLKPVASHRRTVETEYRRGFGGTHFLDVFATLVEHRLHFARMTASPNDVAHFECAALYKHRRHIAAPLVERGFHDCAFCRTIEVGLEFEHLCFEEYAFEEFVNILTRHGGYFHTSVIAAPVFHEEIALGEFLLDFFGVGSGQVYLGDCKHDRHARRLCVSDGLFCLRHHRAVRRHHDNGDVGDFGTTCAHCGERLVSWCIEEGDVLAVGQCNIVCADGLCNAARLAGNNVGIADVVEEFGLAVIHVSHHHHYRCAGLEVFGIVFHTVFPLVFLVLADKLHLIAEIVGYNRNHLGVEPLVDGDDDAKVKTYRNNLVARHVHK